MEKPLRIIGLGGSLAECSSSLAARKLGLAGAKDAGAQVELLDIRTLNLPLYAPGTVSVPEPAQFLVARVFEGDRVDQHGR